MQLSLFEDNRPGILHNMAHEFLLARDLEQALSVYGQILSEFPGDRQAAAMIPLVSEWHDLLSRENCVEASHLHLVWRRLMGLRHAPLRALALDAVINGLSALPHGERVYLEPDFHLGRALMEAGAHREAAAAFRSALASPSLPRGRFLAWIGDALTLAGDLNEAHDSYLAAFLDDPRTVDLAGVRYDDIRFLHASLCCESHGQIAEEECAAWLPVWGWLLGTFTLPPGTCDPGEGEASRFEAALDERGAESGRIWFEMLTLVERLRADGKNDGRQIRLRRLMKRTNPFLFDCYLERLRTGYFAVM